MSGPQQQALGDIVAALRGRTWLSPVSAEEMNRRDRWLANQIEGAVSAVAVEEPQAETPTREWLLKRVVWYARECERLRQVYIELSKVTFYQGYQAARDRPDLTMDEAWAIMLRAPFLVALSPAHGQPPSIHRGQRTRPKSILELRAEAAERDRDALRDEIETLCQAIEGHRGGALTNDGLWHYREKAMALLTTPNGTPACDAVGQPTTDTSGAITRVKESSND